MNRKFELDLKIKDTELGILILKANYVKHKDEILTRENTYNSLKSMLMSLTENSKDRCEHVFPLIASIRDAHYININEINKRVKMSEDICKTMEEYLEMLYKELEMLTKIETKEGLIAPDDKQ